MTCRSVQQSELNQLVVSGTEAELRSGLNGVDTVAAFHTLNKVIPAGVIRGIDQINAGLMSFMQGSSATLQQSQSTERFFMTLMKAIFP